LVGGATRRSHRRRGLTGARLAGAHWRATGFASVETHGWRWEETHSLEELRDVLDFAPIIEGFDRERDAPLLEALREQYSAEGGVRLTHEPRVILGRKAP